MKGIVGRMFSEADLDRIGDAVAAAESGTTGEVAVVIAPHSRTWLRDGWVLAALFGLVAGAGYLALGRIDNWGTFFPYMRATLIGAAVFGASLLFLSYWSFRPRQMERNCRRHALRHFAALAPTRARTAVLILVSLEERQAVVIADRGIAGHLPQDYWHKPQGMIARAIDDNRPVDGLVAAIAEIGSQLARYFPRTADDTNELPDRPVIG
jgi:putative membrane protein